MILTHGSNSINIQTQSVVEVGGKLYPYVQIDNMLFTTLNLDYLPSGVDLGTSGVPQTATAWYYNNDESTYGWNGMQYGLLYNKLAATIVNSSLPSGWSVVTYAVIWDKLYKLPDITIYSNANKWKKDGITGWNGTNDTLFSAVPSGYRDKNGVFYEIGSTMLMWAYETPNTAFKMDTTNNASFWGAEAAQGLCIRLFKYV